MCSHPGPHLVRLVRKQVPLFNHLQNQVPVSNQVPLAKMTTNANAHHQVTGMIQASVVIHVKKYEKNKMLHITSTHTH